MMTRKLRNQIKNLCTGGIEFISAKNNIVNIKLPYDATTYYCEVEGDDNSMLLESFINQINCMLQDRINHLEDCKLQMIERSEYE